MEHTPIINSPRRKNVPFTNATETATRAQTAQMLMNYLSK